MTAELREQFRLRVLALVASAGGVGFRATSLHVHLTANGFECTREQLGDELQYLHDKALVTPVDKILSPENHRWRISAAGRDFLAAQGLA